MAIRLVEALKFLRLPIRLFDAFARLRVPFGEPVLSPFAQGLGLRRIGCTAFRERQLCAGSRPKADRRLSCRSRPFVMHKSKVLHQATTFFGNYKRLPNRAINYDIA